MIVMSEEEYLAKHGVLYPVSDYVLDKNRLPHGETERQKQKRLRDCEAAQTAYQEKRDAIRQEYRDKVANGEIRDLTPMERRIAAANGLPELESTQAARRMCEKCGIDWRTGKRLDGQDRRKG